MQIIEAPQPFEIQEASLDYWQQRPVKNNFFELVWIKQGAGTQCINYNQYAYQAGSLFLLPPLTCHSFQIESPTQFVFLKFTSHFFQGDDQDINSASTWFKEAAYILSHYNQLPGDIIHQASDRKHIYMLIEMILNESKHTSHSSMRLIKKMMNCVLEILIRNIKKAPCYELKIIDEREERIHKLLNYIHAHIHEPQLLKVPQLAHTFAISPTYLSEYFRKKVNTSLREYIMKTKLKWVEIRLLNSDYTLAKIADELNFTDVSHLSKTFKNYVGISIREFRKQGEYQLLKRNNC